VVRAAVSASPVQLDLAGRVVDTWAYSVPVLRAAAGEVFEVELANDLPESTTVHWHGIALRNDMDGVHDMTQAPVGSGEPFIYRFLAPDPGTFFFHPRMGLQLDRALYAPLIVDGPDEAGGYDAEHVLILDDWLDGVDGTPEDALATLTAMSGEGDSMAGMDHGGAEGGMMAEAASDVLGGHAGDVTYPLHLINGRPPADRPTFDAPAGGRARLRLINAASDTAYRVAVGGHRLTVTHADGFPVEPVPVDTLLLGMGERYDVVVDVQPGAHPIVAAAEGKGQHAAAVLRADAAAAAPNPDALPAELDGLRLRYRDLLPMESVRLRDADPDVRVTLELTGDHMGYSWGIDGKQFGEHDPVEVEQGQRVRLVLRNTTTMWHPMHLHGHTFALEDGGARKDTVNVLPDEEVAFSFVADNPGQWMLHCHNTYHLETGMATVLSYVR